MFQGSNVSLKQHIYETNRLTTTLHVENYLLFHENKNSVSTVYRFPMECDGQFNRPTEQIISG